MSEGGRGGRRLGRVPFIPHHARAGQTSPILGPAWVLVTYRAVEVPAGRHVEYAAADGQINRLVINAVELEESGWGEGAEDDGRRALGQRDGALRTEMHVDEDNEKG